MEISLKVFFPIIGNLVRYFVLAGLPFLIMYVLFPGIFSRAKIQARWAKTRDFVREVLHSVQSSVIFGAVIALFTFSPLQAYTGIYDSIHDYPVWWIPVGLFLALLVHDTYFYWMHRTIHHPRIYRWVHKVHHQSVNPSPWASFSFHILEAFVEALIIPLIIILIPMHISTLLAFGIISFMINVYGHLGYEIAPRWFRKTWLFRVLNTSVYHNLHHSRFKGNYGLYFRHWDRWMGTENPDYVKEYDRIQAQRFPHSKPSFSVNMLVPLLFLAAPVTTPVDKPHPIEGRWHDQEGGGVVSIYKEAGKFYGKLVAADHKEDQAKIQGKTIIILRDFEQRSASEFCCGSIFQPREKRTLSGRIILKGPDTLTLVGKYGPFSRSRIWKRIPDKQALPNKVDP